MKNCTIVQLAKKLYRLDKTMNNESVPDAVSRMFHASPRGNPDNWHGER